MTEFLSLLMAGIVYGAIYAVSASGLVVTYNTTGIFNFAHGAMGMILAYLFWQLWQGWGCRAVLSLVIVLLVAAPLLGVVVERVVMRPLVRGRHRASAWPSPSGCCSCSWPWPARSGARRPTPTTRPSS